MILQFFRIFLSSQRILHHYLETFPTQAPAEHEASLRQLIFVETRATNPTLPDYVYRNPMDAMLRSADGLVGLVEQAFKQLAETHLHFRQEQLFVKADTFEAWQEMLSRVTPLPLLAYAFHREDARFGGNDERLWHLIQVNLAKSTLPSLFSPFIDELIEGRQPSDLHIHLNGSTEVDIAWQDAMARPLQYYRKLLKARGRKEVREQYLQIDDAFTEERMYDLLVLARLLRERLVGAVFADEAIGIGQLQDLNRAFATRLPSQEARGLPTRHPVEQHLPDGAQGAGPCEMEAFFLAKTYSRLHHHPALALMLHQYVLILGAFNRLLVHQLDQIGFDQFQRFTYNEGRELSEARYLRRFHQLEGMHRENLAFLEGRFAPKSNARESLKLLKRIVHDYARYHGEQAPNVFGRAPDGTAKRLKLRLVGHFIKKRPSKDDHSYRFQALRNDLAAQARGVVALVDRVSALRELVTGFDAAANELHAPPEVFAPTYRWLRRRGFQNFTYHVGEDFVHLISGIRAIYEATTFLDLNAQNRIGHGTAIGIAPKLWLDRAAPRVHLTRGEWLDNLVFAYDLLSQADAGSAHLHKFQAHVSELFHEIYRPDGAFDVHTLIRAWRLRELDPGVALLKPPREQSLIPGDHVEWEDAERRESDDRRAFQLFRLYHQDEDVRRRDADLIEVDAGFLPAPALTQLQASVVDELNRRCVAIEAMPSSNVRISYYQRYAEHHIFRWLGVNQEDPLPKPIVCLATDNPGIFATHLRNELAHVYNTLTRHYQLSHGDAAELLRELDRNGIRFRFARGLPPLRQNLPPAPKDD